MIDEPTWQKVSAHRAALDQHVQKVRADQRLSDAGKTELIAKAYANTAAAVGDLRGGFEKSVASRRDTLERQAFGTPRALTDASSVISMRDAADRVDNVADGDNRALSALMGRALATDDDVLAKAVLRRGFDEGHRDVISAYVNATPPAEAVLGELHAVRSMDNRHTAAGALAHYGQYQVEKPAELARMSDLDIHHLAAGAESGAA